MIRSSRSTVAKRQSAQSWWRKPETKRPGNPELASEVFACADAMRSTSRGEVMRDRIYEAIYEGRPLGGGIVDMSGYSEITRLSKAAHTGVNITQSKVDALASRLGKKRPFPCISVDGASYVEEKFAKAASAALRSKLGATQIEREKPLILRDALIRGTGCARVAIVGGDAVVERVPRSEILVDAIDARYGRPRNMIRYALRSKDELAAEYPDFEDEINASNRDCAEWFSYGYDSLDHVLVCEAWHLPTTPEAGDGRHVVCIDGVTLLDEEWTSMRFPVATMHWCAPVSGFWGRGLVETLSGIQQKINEVLRDIQEALYYGGQLTVFVPRGANINNKHLTARHPKVVETDGATPTYLAPNPVAPQMFQLLQMLEQMADDVSGLSKDYQNGRTQLGANASGKAMDTLYDIQSDRFALAELSYGLFMVDLGASIIDAARSIAKNESRSKQAAWIRDIKWNRVDLDNGSHNLKLEPVNFLPDSRAGKLETATEMAQAGVITDPTMIAELFDEPDIAAANRTLLGPRHAARHILDIIADEERDLSEGYPDPHMDLEAIKKTLVAEYNEAWSKEAPDEILARYRDVIGYTENLLVQAQPPAPQQPLVTNAAGVEPAQAPLSADPMMGAPQQQALPPDMAAMGLA